jgi:hypothetical protein
MMKDAAYIYSCPQSQTNIILFATTLLALSFLNAVTVSLQEYYNTLNIL